MDGQDAAARLAALEGEVTVLRALVGMLAGGADARTRVAIAGALMRAPRSFLPDASVDAPKALHIDAAAKAVLRQMGR